LSSPIALDQRVPFHLFDHLLRVLGVDGDQSEGNIFQDLDEDATQPEHQNGTKLRVPCHPHRHLHPFDHLLDDDAVDSCVRPFSPHLGHHSMKGLRNLSFVSQPRDDPSYVALVDDVRGENFHDDRETDRSPRLRG